MSKWISSRRKEFYHFIKAAKSVNFPQSLLHRVKSLGASSGPRRINIQAGGKVNHRHLEIADHHVSFVARLSDNDHLRRAVDGILIPRVVGTRGHDQVRDFIIEAMEELRWTVTRDTFKQEAPGMGVLQFENIIATLNPNAERFLLLACHYDSKYFPGEEFLGATDSAVPCAMLLNLAYTLREQLDTLRQNDELSLMCVFFDGEEAFEEWGPKDSIYGAKHLAEKWAKKGFLKRIDLLLLLDLIGAPDPRFYSFFKNTDHWYARLVLAEERLAMGNFLDSYTTSSAVGHRPERYFQQFTTSTFVEDDHVPFMERKVPVLHLIPVPFPDCWHKMTDNRQIIDFNTVENINKVLRVFLLEYLNIGL